MKIILIALFFVFGSAGIKSNQVKKGKIQRHWFNKKEYIVIFDIGNKDKKTISIVISRNGGTMENWNKISVGDSIHYNPHSDTLKIVKRDNPKQIKVYFKNQSKKMKL